MVRGAGATQPGSGSQVHEEGKVPFKDQMIGVYASPVRPDAILHANTQT